MKFAIFGTELQKPRGEVETEKVLAWFCYQRIRFPREWSNQAPPPSLFYSVSFCKHVQMWQVGSRWEEAKAFWFQRARAGAWRADRRKPKQAHKCQFNKRAEPQENRNVGPFLWKDAPGVLVSPKSLVSTSRAVRRTFVRLGRHHKPPVMWSKVCRRCSRRHVPTHTPAVCVFSVCGVRTGSVESFIFSVWEMRQKQENTLGVTPGGRGQRSRPYHMLIG